MESRCNEKYPTAFLAKKYKEYEDSAKANDITIDELIARNANGGLATPEGEEDDAMDGVAEGKGIDAFVEGADS